MGLELGFQDADLLLGQAGAGQILGVFDRDSMVDGLALNWLYIGKVVIWRRDVVCRNWEAIAQGPSLGLKWMSEWGSVEVRVVNVVHGGTGMMVGIMRKECSIAMN